MTAAGREAGPVSDLRQPRTGTPPMLKPGAFGAMTAFPPVRPHCGKKTSRDKGLTRDRRPSQLREGKTSRNTDFGASERQDRTPVNGEMILITVRRVDRLVRCLAKTKTPKGEIINKAARLKPSPGAHTVGRLLPYQYTYRISRIQA